MKPSKETKSTYRKILIASLYKDFSQYEHKYQSGDGYSFYYNYLMVEYPMVVIKIHKRNIFGKVQVVSKNIGVQFHFLSIFNFWFNKDLRTGYYIILKKYFSDIKKQKYLDANKKANEDFLNSLPINLARLEKIKEILDL
jgi:hypothetical protein